MKKSKRLKELVVPSYYALVLTPNLKRFTFTGEEILKFHLAKPSQKITLHSSEIDIKKVILKTCLPVGRNENLIPQISYDQDEGEVTLEFNQELPKGEYTLEFSYTGVLGEKMKGWYKSTYEVQGEKRFLATTQFEEIGARQAFIGIDEPAAKAIFDITLIVPQHLIAISNTIPQEETNIENGLKKVHFSPTPKMSTYTLAFIVGEFDVVEKSNKNNVRIRVFVTPGKKDQAQFALHTGADLLDFYEEYFDITYPLPVLDLIAIPDFDAGAMENWGAVTFREVALLIDEEKSSTAARQWVALVIAHELAHMWFGNLVTMEWWTHLWLNEGFASYIEYFAADKLFPEWNLWDQFFTLDHNSALALDALDNTHPIEVEVPHVRQIKEIFDEISYAKGASIIAMIATYLGEKDFRDGLRLYLKRHSYANATTHDLWEALEEVSNKPIGEIMHNFTQKAGHPILSVSNKKDHIHLSQKRFFSSALKNLSTDTTMWTIPFSLISSEQTQEKEYLMTEKTMKLPSITKGNFIKLNKNETSFFRTIYSKDLYEALQKALFGKRLSAIDRMGILRDAFDASEAGLLSTSHALELSTSYTKETSFGVWVNLVAKLGSVYHFLFSTNLKEPYQRFAREILLHIGTKVGWEKKKNETTDDTLLRSTILYALGKYGDKKIQEKARMLFTNIVEKKPVDPDLKGIVYVLTAENGGEKEFEILKKMYLQETLGQEKNRIGSALMSFRQPHLIQEALEFSLSEHVRLQDMPRFVMVGFGNEYAQEITWNFLKKNWDILFEKFKGEHSLSRLVEGAGSIVSLSLKEEIEEFFRQRPTEEIQRTLKQVVEQIESNLAWKERDQENIAVFLQKYFEK